MDRFACGWHRLVGRDPRATLWVRPKCHARRNHGPGRVPCTDASRSEATISSGCGQPGGPDPLRRGHGDCPRQPHVKGTKHPRGLG